MKEHLKNFALKITFLLLFFISISIYTLNGQERYTNSEIDQKIELSQKDIILTQEKVNDFRRELDNYKSNYEYHTQQQDTRIRDLYSNINIYLLIVSIIIALVGIIGYLKIKSDTKKEVQRDLDEIKKLKEEAEKILEEAKKLVGNIKDKEKEVTEHANSIAETDKKAKELIEKLSGELHMDKKTEQDISDLVNEINSIKPKDNLTAYDWYLNGYNAANEANKLTDKSKKEAKLRDAIFYYQKAAELDSEGDVIYSNWGEALGRLAELKQDESMFRESIEKFTEAVRLNPKNDCFNNWGVALGNFAKLKQDETMLKESIKKFIEAVRLNPKNDIAFHNWGFALNNLAEPKQDETMFKESLEKFAEAVRLNPKNDIAFHNWGVVLGNLAELKQDEAMFKESLEKFTEAVRLNPKNDIAFNNWGSILSNLAKLKQEEAIFKESFEKFAEAVRLNPRDENAFNNWGRALIELWKLTANQKLVEEGVERLKKAVELNPNQTSQYHLACSYSLLNEKDIAFNWLEKYLQNSNTKFDRNYIENDTDLNAIKDDPKFKELLDKYFPKN